MSVCCLFAENSCLLPPKATLYQLREWTKNTSQFPTRCLLYYTMDTCFLTELSSKMWYLIDFQEAKEMSINVFFWVVVPFVSRPHGILCDDGPLTETQRAIHPSLSRMSLLRLFQTFKNHRLVKGSRLWLWSPLVCSLVIILSWLCKGLAGLAVGFSVVSCEGGLELHPAVLCEKRI